MTKIVILVKIFLYYEGSFIDACILRITPLPSKLKTAIPKNNGIWEGTK